MKAYISILAISLISGAAVYMYSTKAGAHYPCQFRYQQCVDFQEGNCDWKLNECLATNQWPGDFAVKSIKQHDR